MVYNKWGLDKAGDDIPQISTRPCTDEELGLGSHEYSDPRSKFYPMNSNGAGWLEPYSKRLQCTDHKLEVLGDYNTDAT